MNQRDIQARKIARQYGVITADLINAVRVLEFTKTGHFKLAEMHQEQIKFPKDTQLWDGAEKLLEVENHALHAR